MKRFLLIPLMFLFSVLHAQDYCAKIKKEVDEEKIMYRYNTPYDEKNVPCMRAERNYSSDPADDLDNFNLILEIPCKFEDILQKTDSSEGEKEEYKLVVEFEDHSKITDETIRIVHDNTAGDGTAKRQAFLPVTAENIKDLGSKKIIKITLATASLDVAADIATPMQHYLQCMWDVKKKD